MEEKLPRKPYPTDVSDEEWAFVAPYLTLMDPEAPQRRHDLREVLNALRWIVRTGAQWRMLPTNFPPWQAAVQEATGDAVEVAFVDQGYTGERAETGAAAHGIRLEVVRLPEAKRGFVLLPRRWVVERSFAWVARFRRLARGLPETFAGLHFLAFACLMLHRLLTVVAQSP